MTTLRMLGWVLLLGATVCAALSQGGPKGVHGARQEAVVGAFPAPVSDCNGGNDQDSFACKNAFYCGSPYVGPKPIASGGWMTVRWENDVQRCISLSPPTCEPKYSMKKTDAKCTEIKVK